MTLVESNGKKARFMREAIRQLGLRDARVAESRIEAVDEPGAYDAITARALATLPLILELGGHLLKPDGRLLAMKGVYPGRRDRRAAARAGRVQDVHPLHGAGAGRRAPSGRDRRAASVPVRSTSAATCNAAATRLKRLPRASA